jgi:integrase
MRKNLNNDVATIHSNIRVIKTYMNRAKEHGYRLAIEPKEIKVTSPTGKIDKLSQEEVRILVDYYNSPYIPDHHRKTLQCFLFSCYSGIRYGDLQQIKRSHINGRQLLIIPNKTRHIGKALNVQLSLSALSLLNEQDPCFDYIYCNQKMNINLKQIAKVTKVFPKLTFHMSRHTFATNFLERGGSVHDLQLFMGHSFIKETIRYVHPTQESLRKAISVFDEF